MTDDEEDDAVSAVDLKESLEVGRKCNLTCIASSITQVLLRIFFLIWGFKIKISVHNAKSITLLVIFFCYLYCLSYGNNYQVSVNRL